MRLRCFLHDSQVDESATGFFQEFEVDAGALNIMIMIMIFFFFCSA